MRRWNESNIVWILNLLEHLLPSFLFLFLNRKPITCKLFRNRNRNSKLVTVNTVVSISISNYELDVFNRFILSAASFLSATILHLVGHDGKDNN